MVAILNTNIRIILQSSPHCWSRFVFCFFWTLRGAILDQTQPDGQKAPGRPGSQHRQVPLRRRREPDPDHPLDEERPRVQERAKDGGHQGEKNP